MKPSTSDRKPSRIQREKRQLILQAALDVFSEQGLRGATLAKIAEASGMSKPHVVYYFGSKDAIYTELLESLLEIWLSRAEAKHYWSPVFTTAARSSITAWISS